MINDLPFSQVFADHDGSQAHFPGFLLVNHGRQQIANERNLAWAYAQATYQSIDFALENVDVSEAAYPALFIARHTLELYLKGLIPNWHEHQPRKKTQHHIDHLIERLRAGPLDGYNELEVEALVRFLAQMALLDPKSMAFRYRDGAVKSYGNAPLQDPEIWVDFSALRKSLKLIFPALDKLWYASEGGANVPG